MIAFLLILLRLRPHHRNNSIDCVITNSIGEKLFGGKEKMKFVNKSLDVQSGWNQVGGKGIYKKRTY